MGFWKRLSEILRKEEYGSESLSTHKTFEEIARVKHVRKEGEKSYRGTLYIKINNYTYLVTPKRSELANYLNLKDGDIVLLTAEKLVEKM